MNELLLIVYQNEGSSEESGKRHDATKASDGYTGESEKVESNRILVFRAGFSRASNALSTRTISTHLSGGP